MEKSETHSFSITMEKTGPMEFKTTFDKNYPDLYFDEPSKAGGNDKYPNAIRILTAAIMNCLSASFNFCLQKSRIPLENLKLKATATTTIGRNEKNRIRIQNIKVILEPIFENSTEKFVNEIKNKLKRCKNIFEDYCVVTSSIKKGIDVKTTIII